MYRVETHANALISEALKAFRKAQVAQTLLSNDSISVERSLAQPEAHVAANRPDITVAQTFGGLIPN